MVLIPVLVTFLLAFRHVIGLNATQWRSQSVYQVLTDRFALTTDNYAATCSNLANYCGGTFKGIANHLDYIQGMGFTAIWISPIVAQLPQTTPDGQAYHGYWAQNIYQINSNFGTAADLKNLSAQLHARNMYLMVDVVTNHMGYFGCPTCIDYSVFNPFNSATYYHPNCTINYGPPYNLTNIEQCWEENYPATETLPDLRTESSAVQSAFSKWIAQLVANYTIDGLRVDSVQQVNPSFWSTFRSNAGVYMVGEVFDSNSSYVCSYQASGMDGVLNYPAFESIRSTFQGSSGSMASLANTVNTVKGNCSDSTLLGSFLENHDNNRFPGLTNPTPDSSMVKNAIAFTMLADGIPIIYYGQEQGFTGAIVPSNREILWPSQYNKSSALYVFIGQLNAIRNHAIYIDNTYLTYKAYPVSYTSNTIVMRKGIVPAVIGLFTNLGVNSATTSFSIPMSSTGYSASQSITEVLSCTAYTTDASGTLSGQITAGRPQVFYPTSALVNNGLICPGLTNMCTVLFEEIVQTQVGQTIKIAGDATQLGAWNTSNAVALSATQYTSSNPEWSGTVTFVAGTVIQYKGINVGSSGSVTYEGGSNHIFTVPTGCTTTVTASAAWQT